MFESALVIGIDVSKSHLDAASTHAPTPLGRFDNDSEGRSVVVAAADRVVLLEHDLQHLAAANGLTAFDGDLVRP